MNVLGCLINFYGGIMILTNRYVENLIKIIYDTRRHNKQELTRLIEYYIVMYRHTQNTHNTHTIQLQYTYTS